MTFAPLLTGAIAGGIVGYRIGRNGNPEAVNLNQLIEFLKQEKPSNYFVKRFDATEARDEEEVGVSGDYLMVVEDASNVTFKVKFNEQDRDEIDLRKILSWRGAYYRFFISNQAGGGSLTLIGGKGIEIAPRLPGIEELAARLDSPVTFDRRGEIFWMDDFEDTLFKWGVQIAQTGTGGAAARDTTAAHRGNASVKVTTGSVIGDITQLNRNFYVPVSGRIGLEIAVASEKDVSITLGISRNTSVARTDGNVVIDQANGRIKYMLADGSFVVLQEGVDAPSMTPSSSETLIFHKFKMVLDFVKNEYVRAIINDVEIDMAGKALRSQAPTSEIDGRMAIAIASQETGNIDSYVDDAIVTQNEP